MHVLYAGAMHATKTLLIVYHSHTGGTRQMAEAAAQAARGQEGVAVHLKPAQEAGPEDLLEADGYSPKAALKAVNAFVWDKPGVFSRGWGGEGEREADGASAGKRYGLVQRVCHSFKKTNKDVLIYQSNYRLSHADQMFLDELERVRKEISE